MISYIILFLFFSCDENPTSPENIYGCTNPDACNFNQNVNIEDDSCIFPPEGECDCEGNVLDECNVCGGTGIDEDEDGICDYADDCVGIFDTCNVCNGPGEIYECGCFNPNDGYDCNGILQNDLDIYEVWKQNTSLELDENDFYHFNYNPTGISESDYGTVKYNTEISTTVVHWESPDSFFVEFQGQLIGNPIINYSTYSGSDGYGQQLFYVYSDFIGDTLTIYGFTSSDIDSVFVIIE